MSNFVFFILWWVIGFVSVQIMQYRQKSGRFSKTEVWCMGELLMEIVLSFFGPIITLILTISTIGNFIRRKFNYEGDFLDCPLHDPTSHANRTKECGWDYKRCLSEIDRTGLGSVERCTKRFESCMTRDEE